MTKSNKKRLPSIEYLKKRYEIDPLTGIGKYKINIPNVGIKIGDVVKGQLKKANVGRYKYVSIDGKGYAWHRICFAIYHGIDPYPLDVDHQNLNKLDNSKKNLLKITTAKNNQNKPIYKNNKLGVSGIYQTQEGRFRTAIYKDSKEINCGTFTTIEEAIEAKKLMVYKHN